MESSRFDAISRVLATRIGRRQLVAAALGLAATGVGMDAASAADSRRSYCRALRTTCTRNSHCCSGFCDTRRVRNRTRLNKCACPVDTTECGGRCVDIAHDFDHCGGCGQACDATVSDTCWHDHCHCGEAPACTDGATCVNGNCVAPIVPLAMGNCDTDLSPEVPFCVHNASGDDWLALCQATVLPDNGQAWVDNFCWTDAECASVDPICSDPNVRCDCMLGVQPFGQAYIDFSAVFSNAYQAPPNTGFCLPYTADPNLCVVQ